MVARISLFIVRFVSINDENNGASSKDSLHVHIGLIIRATAKRFKDTLNGLIRQIWVDSNMM